MSAQTAGPSGGLNHAPPTLPPHSAPRWLALFGVWLLYAAFGLIATSLSPLIAPIEADLEISHAAMGSILGAWQLIYIAAAVPCGILLDRIGARRALALGALLIALSAWGRAAADGYWSMLLAVGLFGIGGPIISSGAPKVVAERFTGSTRGLAMGIYITGPAVGGVVSLTLTHSWLLPVLGDWRAVMQLWAILTLASAGAWLLCSRPTRAERQLARANASDQANEAGDDEANFESPSTLSVMATLVQQPAVRLLLAMSVAVFLINHGLNNWLPELLRNGGMTATNAGFWAAIPTLVGIAGSLLIPRLATPGRRFNILLALALAAFAATLLLQFTAGIPLFAGLLLQGLARSALMTVLILTLVELPGIGERYAGTASGLFFSAAEVGGVLGPLGMGLAYQYSGDFQGALAALSVIAILLCLGTAKLRSLAQAGSNAR